MSSRSKAKPLALPFFLVVPLCSSVGVLTVALSCGAVGCAEPSPDKPEAVGTAQSAVSISGLFSTGVDDNGVPLAADAGVDGAVDPHYVLSSNDPTQPGPQAFAVPSPYGTWSPNMAGSQWISGMASIPFVTAVNYIYNYTLTFNLPMGFNPASASVTGTWLCDETCTVSLNGTTVATHSEPNPWATVGTFNIPPGAGNGFMVGMNTLTFQVPNPIGPGGLQVITLVAGCNQDTDCGPTQFCDTQTGVCAAKLANGAPIPTLSMHTPPLTGTCTPTVAASVCQSGVCDLADNACGYANGDGPCMPGGVECRSGVCDTADDACGYANDDGPCTPANGANVCRSGVCDLADAACGYADDDGPCTPANGANVCRSGACSVNDTCEPQRGCNVDADCGAGSWCDESMHACMLPLANGTPIPNDPQHTSPPLNGTCSPQAAMLVCLSGVCDTDGACGYANGDGPCTPASGATVCRSGTCSVNDTCIAQGTCASDTDCATGQWCDESMHTCTPLLANGTAIPTDPPHVSPTLDGICSTAAAALVCSSGACSPHANVCIPTSAGACAVDADCSAGMWCDEKTFTCSPQLANGAPIPNDPTHTDPTLDGTCTPTAAVLVCQSGVCDTADNTCGLVTGTECTAADCQSGYCADGVCCDTACTGTCMACNVAGSVGTCTFVPAGSTDPKATAPCNAPSACNGAGVCLSASQSSATCTTNADCPTGTFCAGGACVGELGQGTQCKVDTDCATVPGHPHCSLEGVCCDLECKDKCEQCIYPTTGTCSVLSGVDLHQDCHKSGDLDGGELSPCSGLVCTRDPNSTTTVAGTCAPATAETLCALGTCTEDGLHGTGALYCTEDAGVFTCPSNAPATLDCTVQYRCELGVGVCKSECVTVDDCVPGYVCNLSGRCQPQSIAFPAAPASCSLPARRVGDDRPWGRVALLLLPALVAATRCRRRSRSRGARDDV